MPLSTVVVLFVALVALGALAQPVALKLRLPASVVLAFFGLAVGFASHYSLQYPGTLLPVELASVFTNLPVGSSLFLYVFLPTLIFQSALLVDVHRVLEDLFPILILALVAVVVATVGVAYVLWPISGMPLVACLILGSLVATTDPVAVISIFKDVGAPERLARLVEGESLFNDAAAISLFLVFTEVLTQSSEFHVSEAVRSFLVMPLGGAALGFALSSLLLLVLQFLAADRLTTVSLSLAVPYLAFWLAEHEFHVSGIIALVIAGVTLASLAPGRVRPEIWRYLQDIWEQLAAWSAILIFFMTALLVPKLISGAQPFDLVLLAILFVVALIARASILFGLFPLLSKFKMTPPLTMPFRIVTVWGGLRGSMTLALALSVTENPAIPPRVAAFVASLATGYTLLTLFVQGTTLRWLIQRLGLTELTGVDRAIRDIALDATAARVSAFAGDMATRFGAKTGSSARDLDVSAGARVVATERNAVELAPEDKIALALVSLTARERDLIVTHFAQGTVVPHIARWLAADLRRRLDAVRTLGLTGYSESIRNEVAFLGADRLAVALQRRLGYSRMLARRLSSRFQKLMETALVLDSVLELAESELTPILGEATAVEARRLVAERRERIDRELAAVRLQYPEYVRRLEGWVIERSIRARELIEIEDMRTTGLINYEVERSALKGIARKRGGFSLRSPDLDLQVDPNEILDQCSLFGPLNEADRSALAKLLRPSFEVPGIPIITRGERGSTAYFISSGAVEIDTGSGVHRLGRGDFFGELALLFDMRRQATVRAIAYSTILSLAKADFDRFLVSHPLVKEKIEAIGRQRLEENSRSSAGAAD